MNSLIELGSIDLFNFMLQTITCNGVRYQILGLLALLSLPCMYEVHYRPTLDPCFQRSYVAY